MSGTGSLTGLVVRRLDCERHPLLKRRESKLLVEPARVATQANVRVLDLEREPHDVGDVVWCRTPNDNGR